MDSFNQINDKDYREIFIPYSGKVFENICKYHLLDSLVCLNNKGIHNLKIELTGIENRNDIGQLDYIKQISSFLSENQQWFKTFMSKKLVKDLIESMDGYVVHRINYSNNG